MALVVFRSCEREAASELQPREWGHPCILEARAAGKPIRAAQTRAIPAASVSTVSTAGESRSIVSRARVRNLTGGLLLLVGPGVLLRAAAEGSHARGFHLACLLTGSLVIVLAMALWVNRRCWTRLRLPEWALCAGGRGDRARSSDRVPLVRRDRELRSRASGAGCAPGRVHSTCCTSCRSSRSL